ncbi:MAG: hypothetical protein U0Q55_22090 [Vicinamibacterales bacterium]
MTTSRFRTALVVTITYCLLAVALTWPLAANLMTALPGDIHGDTGVYAWNLWVFSHEWFAHGRLPFSTDHIFASTGSVDFSLHNYTPLAALAAVPLIPRLGLVGAYNCVLLMALVSSALGAYALARHCGFSRPGAVVAGAVFASLPMTSARTTAHLSLVTNAALPLFMLALLRTIDLPSPRRAVRVGAMVAIATYSDAYYGVFCVLMGVFVLWFRFVGVVRQPRVSAATAVWLDGAVAALLLIAAAAALSGRDVISVGGTVITGLGHPYSVVALATALALARLWSTHRPTLVLRAGDAQRMALIAAGAVAVITCLVLLAPVLGGLAWRWQHGQLPAVSVFWRSSPRGVDLLAYLVPNPTHRWLGAWTSRWLLPPVQDAFPELVASCSLTLLVALVVSHRRKALPAMWLAFTAAFAVLSLGPFVHVASINTMVPGPWALLRYLPVIGMVRSPSRFAIVAGLGIAMLAGAAVQTWLADRTVRVRMVAATAAVVVGFELLPLGRVLFPAAVPSVFALIAAEQDESGRVLMLPTGIRDGTASTGDFDPSSSYFQTIHQHPVLGGYISRVSDWRREISLQDPVLRVLYAYSAKGEVEEAARGNAVRHARAFMARTCLAWVVLDRARATESLRAFATEAFGLTTIQADAEYELMAPAEPVTCTDGRRPTLALRRAGTTGTDSW